VKQPMLNFNLLIYERPEIIRIYLVHFLNCISQFAFISLSFFGILIIQLENGDIEKAFISLGLIKEKTILMYWQA